MENVEHSERCSRYFYNKLMNQGQNLVSLKKIKSADMRIIINKDNITAETKINPRKTVKEDIFYET